MKKEVQSAVDFMTNLLRSGHVAEHQTESFNATLKTILCNRYQNHWFPEKPFKGSGYRCIRFNHNLDPIIREAGNACGLNDATLEVIFPRELTMWVDPQEVSYRIGENGSVGVLFDLNNENQEESETQIDSDQESTMSEQSFQQYSDEDVDTNNIPQQQFYSSCKQQFIELARDAVNYQQLSAFVSS